MRRTAAVATVLAVLVAWAVWSGCGGGATSRGAPSGSGGTGGAPATEGGQDTAGAGGAGAGGSVTAEAAPDVPSAIDAAPPYPGAEACPDWAGWYRAPGLPKGCLSACVPDDPKLRIPSLKWDARDDWCPGCKSLETSWWPNPQPSDRPVVPYVQGLGAGPDFGFIIARMPNGSIAPSIYDQTGTAVVGLRSGEATICGTAQLEVADDGQTTGLRYRDGLYSNQRWMLRPVGQASELLSATQPDFTYPDAFVGNDNAQGSWFTPGWIAEEFTGFMSVANVKTGAVAKVDTMPGAVAGEYDRAVVVGDAVFALHYTNKADWMIVQNGVVKPFLGGADVDIDRFATDGKWIVWNEGSQLSYDPKNPTHLASARYDFYRAPFTTDPTKLQRQLLVPDTPGFYGVPTLANGHFTDMVVTGKTPTGGSHTDTFVVDVETGQAWMSDLPDNYVWGERTYPTATELWGGIEPDAYSLMRGVTVARVPYADMKQIQAGLP